MIKVSVMYPNAPGARFDHEYYRTKHMPMVKNRMGESLKYYTVDKGLAGGAPGAPATYIAMGHLFCDSTEVFRQGLRTAREGDPGRHSELHRPDPGHTDQRSHRRLERSGLAPHSAASRRTPSSRRTSATAATACRNVSRPIAPMQPIRNVSTAVNLPG